MDKYYSTRLANREHRCNGCGEKITPGERYLRIFYPPSDVIPYVIVGKNCYPCSRWRRCQSLFM